MKPRTDQEILEFFKTIKRYDFDVTEVSLERLESKIKVTVSQMYEYVPVDFSVLKRIGEFFETDKVNGSEGDFYNGCETCDYGSSYEVTFVIEE